MEKKMNVKDLINIGLFTAIYVIVTFAFGMTGYIPIFMVLLPFLISFGAGIPFMLFLTKVKKFGMVSIMGALLTLVMFGTGHGWPVLVIGLITSLLSDLILSSGKYRSRAKTVAGFCVFNGWVIGNMLPLYIMRDSYFESLRSGYGDEYAAILMSLLSLWMVPVLIVLLIAGGILGAMLGRKVLKKHFERAGIA
ncbi:MAG: MptD family putative ECF transporter S component [Spirochaetales bacterium]|nr:MptD family putative ECF transporter S component [Spirochaetales bacterium]